MKTRLLINSLAAMASVIYAVFFISCEEEVYNIYIPEQEKPTADTLFTRAVETGPTNDCPYGSYLFEQYKNGVLALELSICKDSAKYILLPGDTIPVFIHDTVTEIRVDTVISIIHDTIIKVVRDTVTNIRIDTVSVMDTLKIVEVDTVTLIKTDTLIITELDTVTVTKTDTLVKKIYIHHKSQCEDFNTGSSPDYWEKGWFDENASESDKVNRYFFNPGNTAITGLPKFWKPCAVDFIKFLYGSRLPYKIEVILEDDKGLWHIIKNVLTRSCAMSNPVNIVKNDSKDLSPGDLNCVMRLYRTFTATWKR